MIDFFAQIFYCLKALSINLKIQLLSKKQYSDILNEKFNKTKFCRFVKKLFFFNLINKGCGDFRY
jgi:hypothetical protein